MREFYYSHAFGSCFWAAADRMKRISNCNVFGIPYRGAITFHSAGKTDIFLSKRCLNMRSPCFGAAAKPTTPMLVEPRKYETGRGDGDLKIEIQNGWR